MHPAPVADLISLHLRWNLAARRAAIAYYQEQARPGRPDRRRGHGLPDERGPGIGISVIPGW